MTDRYDRQRKALGDAAHERIRNAKVLVVGVGGLGCPAATYLAGAGVARLGLCDPDLVDASNLHRQTLFATADVGKPKVEAARGRLSALNPDVAFASIRREAKASNAADVVVGWDVVLDCTDSLDARYALSDACRAAGIPLVQAGIAAGEGQVAILCGRDGPCYRCLHPHAEAGPSCADEGVLGPLCGMVGSIQAAWTLHLLAGDAAYRPGRMALVDDDGSTTTVGLTRRSDCKHSVTQNAEGPACPMPWNAPQTLDVSVQEFAPRINDVFLLDVREPDEHEEYALPGSMLIPLGQLPHRVGELPKDRPIVVYCAVGGRSARAVAMLRSRGYDAVNLRGGLRAWMLAGYAG